MSSYIETWDVTVPSGSEDASRGDDRIRELKRALVERFGQDHEFEIDETGNNKIGYHKKVTLTKRTVDPDPVADAGIIYEKDVGSGQMEAFHIDEAGNIAQLTNRGALARLTKEVIMWFGTVASIPNGLFLCDGQGGRPDLRDRFIVGARQDDTGVAKTTVEGSLAQSASPVHNHTGLTGSTALTTDQIPAHTHAIIGTGADGNVVGEFMSGSNAGGYTHNWVTESTGGGNGHTHTISSVTAIPPYFALAFISPFNS